MHAEFRTDRGRIRHHNEDNGGVFENKDKQPIVIVADGMGAPRRRRCERNGSSFT